MRLTLKYLWIVLVSNLLVACGTMVLKNPAPDSVINVPTQNSTTSIPMEVEFKKMKPGTLKIRLIKKDTETDITNQFTIPNTTEGVATINSPIPLGVGHYTVQLNSEVWYSLYQKYATLGRSDSFAIEAPPPDFTLGLGGAFDSTPGDSINIPVAIDRKNGFSKEIKVTLVGGANFEMNAVTVPAAAASATLVIAVKELAPFASNEVEVQAVGDGITRKSKLTIKVFPKMGAFAESKPAGDSYHKSGTNSSPDNKFEVVNTPIGTNMLTSTFQKLPNHDRVEMIERYYIAGSNSFGGAFFCPNSAKTWFGGVLAANPGGSAAHFVGSNQYTLIDLKTRTSPTNIGVEANKQTSSGYLVTSPRFLFSPDCLLGVAIATGGNFRTSNYLAVVFDLRKGTKVGELEFNGNFGSFKAEVMKDSQGKAAVHLTADGASNRIVLF